MAEERAHTLPNYENWADIHLELARIFVARHDHDQATIHLNEALRTVSSSILDADLASIFVEFAKIAAYQRDFTRAIAQLGKALDATRPSDLMRARVLLLWGDLVHMQKNVSGALWYYYRAKIVFLASSVDASNAVVSNALEVIERRVNTGREQKTPIINGLQEQLGNHILSRDRVCIVVFFFFFFWLSLVFDLYDETLALVRSTRNKLAPTAFCYALIQLADVADLDPTQYELDFDAHLEEFPAFKRALVDEQLKG